MSGHGLYAQSFELDVIAAVVIGGTMLSGGSGYIFGTMFGVLVTVLIQALILFNGKLSSWWIHLAIGALTLIFIGVQSQLAGRKSGRRQTKETCAQVSTAMRNRRMLLYGGGAVIVIVLAVLAVNSLRTGRSDGSATKTPEAAACQLKPFRQDHAASLTKAGAVIVYERNGGKN